MDERPSHTRSWPSDAIHNAASSSQHTVSAIAHHRSLWVKRTYCLHTSKRGLGDLQNKIWPGYWNCASREQNILLKCYFLMETKLGLPKMRGSLKHHKCSFWKEVSEVCLRFWYCLKDLFSLNVYIEIFIPQLILLRDRDFGRWCVDEGRA